MIYELSNIYRQPQEERYCKICLYWENNACNKDIKISLPYSTSCKNFTKGRSQKYRTLEE